MPQKPKQPRVVLVSRSFIKKRGGLLLAIKRSPKDRNNADKWECAGGKLDEGQDLAHAQEREVMEETGLVIKPIHPLVSYDSFIISDGPYQGLTYIVLFGVARLVGGNLVLSKEHTDHMWVGYDMLLRLDLTAETRKAAIVLEKHLQ